MSIKIAALRWAPPFAQGYVRDLRVRWALEEAGFSYEAVLIGFETKDTHEYRAWQPFGQVPAYRDDDVDMFESGAIVLYLAEKSETLSPKGAAGRARVMTWIFAAINSVEPHVQNYVHLDAFHTGEPWVELRRPSLLAILKERLAVVCAQLDGSEYLTGEFSAADLMMTSVLRELVQSGVLGTFPILETYRLRCEARPAFARAMEAQMAPFRKNAPA